MDPYLAVQRLPPKTERERSRLTFAKLVQKAGLNQEAINAPALHRRIDAICRQLDAIGDLGVVREDLAKMKTDVSKVDLLEKQLEDVQGRLSHQETLTASLYARISNLESENKAMMEQVERLQDIILTPGRLEIEQQQQQQQQSAVRKQRTVKKP